MSITVIQKHAEVNGNIVAYVDIYLGKTKIVIDKSKRAWVNNYLRVDGFVIGIVDTIPCAKYQRYEIVRKENTNE